MRNRIVVVLFCLTALIGLTSWGAWGHQHINKSAVFALPDSMRVFFYNHIDFITEESVVPDLRRYAIRDKEESPRHFIDLENYGSPDTVQKLPKSAYQRYDDKYLQKNGTLPWVIQDLEDRLTNAFKNKNKSEILYLAANLGHYIGDAHMPLHTTINYDGQLSGQKGIHAFWESQLPELFGSTYNFYTGDAHYIPDLSKETWQIIVQSHGLIDSLLGIDKSLAARYPKGKIYKTDSTGALIKNNFKETVHTREYAAAYHDAMRGMVESQLRGAIKETANFWFTAWVNAGRPDLSGLDAKRLTQRNRKWYRKDLKTWQKGRLENLESTREY